MVSKSNIYQEGNEILQLGEKFGTKNTISENFDSKAGFASYKYKSI